MQLLCRRFWGLHGSVLRLNLSTYRISNPKGIKINGYGIDWTYITDLTECAGTMGSGTGYCAYDTVPMSCGGAALFFSVSLQSGQTFEISDLTITTPRNDPGGIIALKGAGIFKLHDVKFKDYRGRLLVLQTNSLQIMFTATILSVPLA